MAWGLKDKELGLTRKELSRYSISRALNFLVNPMSQSARKAAGFELDVSEQICKRDNRETEGVLIPQEVLNFGYRTNRPMPQSGHIMTEQMLRGAPPPSHLQKRTTLTAGTAATAGNLVDTELRSVIDVLVENTLALQNVPSYTVMGDPVYFPRQTGRVQASWGTEGVGPIVEGIDSETLGASEFSNVTTQTAVNNLSGATVRWSLITISSKKHLAFKNISASDEAVLTGLEAGRQIQVFADGETEPTQSYVVQGAYDTNNDRIEVGSAAVPTDLTDGTEYDLKTDAIAAVTAESNPTFDRVSFTAKHLKCLVPITRTLLIQASEDADDIIRHDLAIGNAKALDTAIFYGTGDTNNQPQGIKGTTGIVSVTWDANDIYEKVLDTWAQIGVQNVPSRNLKWIVSWRFCHDCKRAQKMHNYSHLPVISKDGTIDGVPVEVTSQLVGTNSQTAEGFMADYLEGALVLWQDLEVNIDPYSKLDAGIVRFVSTLICDFNATRPGAFGRLGA